MNDFEQWERELEPAFVPAHVPTTTTTPANHVPARPVAASAAVGVTATAVATTAAAGSTSGAEMSRYIVTADRQVTPRREFAELAAEPFLAEDANEGGAPFMFWHRVRLVGGKYAGQVVDLPPMFQLTKIELTEFKEAVDG